MDVWDGFDEMRREWEAQRDRSAARRSADREDLKAHAMALLSVCSAVWLLVVVAGAQPQWPALLTATWAYIWALHARRYRARHPRRRISRTAVSPPRWSPTKARNVL